MVEKLQNYPVVFVFFTFFLTSFRNRKHIRPFDIFQMLLWPIGLGNVCTELELRRVYSLVFGFVADFSFSKLLLYWFLQNLTEQILIS